MNPGQPSVPAIRQPSNLIRADVERVISGTPNQTTIQFCTFTLEDSYFGVDILDVQEIATPPEITKLYHASAYVAGVVNIRGQIVLCLDLRRIFNMAPVRITPESRLILFKKTIGPDFGILVDCVGDIIEVEAQQIEYKNGAMAAKKESLASSHVVRGVCMQSEGLMLMINSYALLNELDNKIDSQIQNAGS